MTRILIVEDDPGSRDLLCEVLHMAGYDTDSVEDGSSALEKIAQCQPDLVLLDIEIPLVDGYEVIRKIRESSIFANLPVCAVTARAMRGERRRVLAAGFDAYITKPIDPDNLVAQVAYTLVVSQNRTLPDGGETSGE